MTTVTVINLDGHKVLRAERHGTLVTNPAGKDGYFPSVDALARALEREGLDLADVKIKED
jgi:hypothetical protein